MLISDLSDLTEALQWCDSCREHQDGHCDGCHRRFLENESRYRSQTFHYHPATIGGVAGTRGVQKELCVDCYRVDHAKAYPLGEVPDLPDLGVDPKFHAQQRKEFKRARIDELLNRAASGSGITPAEAEEVRQAVAVGLRFS